MNKKEHLNNEGVEQILSIVSQMNSKRSFDDKYNFCKTVTGLTRDENNGNLSVKLDLPADWVQGFLTGCRKARKFILHLYKWYKHSTFS